MKKRVVITGIGAITPIGIGIDNFWKNCLKGEIAVEKIPSQWQNYYKFQSNIWSPLPAIDFFSYNLSKVEKLQIDKANLMALCAAQEAVDNAKLSYKLYNEKKNTYSIDNLDKNRSGVFIGTGVGGITSVVSAEANHILNPQKQAIKKIEHIMEEDNLHEISSILQTMKKNMIMPHNFNPFIVSMIMPNAASSLLGIKYSLKGHNKTFCAACASSTVAIGNAFQAIQKGELDLALSGGTEYLGDDFGSIFRGFDVAQTLVRKYNQPESANRPFDLNRNGFLFSEGAASVLVLEELSHAQKRGASIIAEVVAYSETFDAYNIMMIDPNPKNIYNLFYEILKDAAIKAADVDYINGHGTGTLLNDEIEAGVIEEVFGTKVLINSTKSLLGHTLGASGAIETAVTALSILNNNTHICKNLENPIGNLNYVLDVHESPINYAISHSFAFGGHNAALLLKKYNFD